MDVWPIGSVVVVCCIVVFLGMELLAHLMGPRKETESNPEVGYDAFSKGSAYSLTALVLLFVLLCIVMAVGMFLPS
jgi:hypothetical protein